MFALLDAPAASSRYVARVTPIDVTIPVGQSSATQTVAVADVTRAAIFFNGYTNDSAAGVNSEVYARVTLTNATTVTATRDPTASTINTTVKAVLVEFRAALVDSVQYGTVALSAIQTTNTASITAVTAARSAVLYLGQTTDNSSGGASATTLTCSLDLTSSTVVTTNRNTASENVTVGFCVVQFASGTTTSVQQTTLTDTSSSASYTKTITSVDAARALLLYNGATSANASLLNAFHQTELTNGTTVTLTRAGTSTSSRTVYFTVVEFAGGVLKSMQRNATSCVSATSASTSISAVGASAALVGTWWLTSATGATGATRQTVRLANATTVTSERGVAGTNTNIYAWQVAEFA